jgi:steroid delta-isomerase-like uncharacterized protein
VHNSIADGFGRGLSRREALGIAGTVLTGSALLGLSQGNTASVIAAQEDEVLDAWASAWSSGDPTQVTAVFAEDGAYEDIPTSTVSRGTAEIAAWAAGYFASVRGVTQSVESWFAIPGGVLVLWLVEATHIDNGNTVSFRGASILELTEDRIAREIAYYDNATFIRQAGGVCELPPSAGTPVAGARS